MEKLEKEVSEVALEDVSFADEAFEEVNLYDTALIQGGSYTHF